MSNHFYGYAYEEHGEKEIKDFTPIDWIIIITFFGMILAAVVMGFMNLWGIMVILVGTSICLIHAIARVVVGLKNKITPWFCALGCMTIIGGIITATGHYEYLFLYGMIVYVIVAFFVGILCLYLAFNKRRKRREYSLLVEAECELVDEKRMNLFRFDDIVKNPYDHPINDNVLRKPGFHYWVNGQEYFVESTVYYGDLNKGFEEGNKVTLRVNPKNPTEILPENVGTAMETIMGVFWIVAGIVVIVIMMLGYLLGLI